MDCEKYAALMNGHLDKINTPQEEEQLQEHLRTCALCREMFEQMQENDACLKSMQVQAPSDLTASIMQKVRVVPVKQSKRPMYRTLIATGIATAAIIAIAVVGKFSFPTADKASDAVCEDVTAYAVRSKGDLVIELPLTETLTESMEDEAYFFGDPVDEETVEKVSVNTDMPILVIRADASELEFEGDRIAIRDLRDRLKSSEYRVSGNETAAYAVTWEELVDIASAYEGIFEMEKYYLDDQNYLDATIIFCE